MALAQPKKVSRGAWGFFLSENRPAYTKAYAGQKAAAISRMAGEAWKKQSAAQKAPFEKKYEVASLSLTRTWLLSLQVGE